MRATFILAALLAAFGAARAEPTRPTLAAALAIIHAPPSPTQVTDGRPEAEQSVPHSAAVLTVTSD